MDNTLIRDLKYMEPSPRPACTTEQSPSTVLSEFLKALITLLPHLLQLSSIVLQPTEIEHYRVLLARNVCAKYPTIRLLEQTVVG